MRQVLLCNASWCCQAWRATMLGWATIPCAPACREGRLYLQWLMSQLRTAGCAVEQRQVASVQELAPAFDVVVNCAGGGLAGGAGGAARGRGGGL